MSRLSEIPVIVIGGPTGVGKTDLSIRLAQHYGGEIINGDSLQVYRDLNIGTGKILPEEMAGVPHHLIDHLPPDATYNASQFKHDATACIQAIHERGRLPIIVGGTGLYLEGLLYDLEFGHAEGEDPRIRLELEQLADQEGGQALWERLKLRDPQAAAKIPPQNVRRIIRALEVIEVTGERFSDQQSHQQQRHVFDDLLLVLDRPRDLLYDRINRRVEQMVEAGLEDEVRALYEQDGSSEWQSINGIGYKEWWPYFAGAITRDEVVAQIQQNSRRYAKRQLTWFRNRMSTPHWLDLNEPQALAEAMTLVDAHLTKRPSQREGAHHD